MRYGITWLLWCLFDLHYTQYTVQLAGCTQYGFTETRGRAPGAQGDGRDEIELGRKKRRPKPRAAGAGGRGNPRAGPDGSTDNADRTPTGDGGTCAINQDGTSVGIRRKTESDVRDARPTIRERETETDTRDAAHTALTAHRHGSRLTGTPRVGTTVTGTDRPTRYHARRHVHVTATHVPHGSSPLTERPDFIARLALDSLRQATTNQATCS